MPFLILRGAGLPSWIEENIVSQVVKVLLTVGVFLLLGYLGKEKYAEDILKWIGK